MALVAGPAAPADTGHGARRASTVTIPSPPAIAASDAADMALAHWEAPADSGATAGAQTLATRVARSAAQAPARLRLAREREAAWVAKSSAAGVDDGAAVAPEHGGDADVAPENGGDAAYASFEALAADYAAGLLHPGDVKASLTESLNALLEPVRRHFASGEPKRLLEQVCKYRVTR